MPIADLYDWLAVVEADSISERLKMRADLYYARPFSKEAAAESNSQRELMNHKFDALMLNDVDMPQDSGDAFWGAIKQARLYAVEGGKK